MTQITLTLLKPTERMRNTYRNALGVARQACRPEHEFNRREFAEIRAKICANPDGVLVTERELTMLWDAMATFKFRFRGTAHIDEDFLRAEDYLTAVDLELEH